LLPILNSYFFKSPSDPDSASGDRFAKGQPDASYVPIAWIGRTYQVELRHLRYFTAVVEYKGDREAKPSVVLRTFLDFHFLDRNAEAIRRKAELVFVSAKTNR
jgi:hypothetical protein